jgi:hypothetical protein
VISIKKWECVIILGTLFRKLYQPKRLRTSQVHNCGNIIKGNLLDLLVMFTKKNQHLIPSHEFHFFFPPFHRSRPSPGHSWTSRPSATDTRGVPGSFAAPWASTKLRSLLRYRLGQMENGQSAINVGFYRIYGRGIKLALLFLGAFFVVQGWPPCFHRKILQLNGVFSICQGTLSKYILGRAVR